MESLKEVFKIGCGPSSSHTMGPERAAQKFKNMYPNAYKYRVELYGSLAATGKGHMTDYIIKKTLSPKHTDILWNALYIHPYHTNYIKFVAIDENDNDLAVSEFFSGRFLMPSSIDNKEDPIRDIEEIIKQINGDEGKFSLFEENTELKITDKIDIIKDIFDLNLNNKKVLNKVYHELEKFSVDAEFLLETKNMENSLLKYIYYLIENYDYPLEIIEEIDLKEIFKLFSVKLSLCFSNKIEDFIDLLEDKINYPEKIEFKDRCDFSNLRSEFEKFAKIFYQVLAYLTIFALICIVIPIILILTYQFLIYLITLVTTIGKVIVATIYYY